MASREKRSNHNSHPVVAITGTFPLVMTKKKRPINYRAFSIRGKSAIGCESLLGRDRALNRQAYFLSDQIGQQQVNFLRLFNLRITGIANIAFITQRQHQ